MAAGEIARSATVGKAPHDDALVRTDGRGCMGEAGALLDAARVRSDAPVVGG